MNPFTATIVKQSLLIGLGAGALAFAVYFMIKMAALQHALTLNMAPPALG